MAQSSDYVKKQTMYIGIAIAVIVGFLGGVIYSSVQSDTVGSYPQQQAASPPMAQQGQGIDPQKASAILELERRVVANPQDVNAWTQLGNNYFDTNRFSNAIRAYEKSLELRPGNPNILTDLGVMYRRNGDPTKAVNAFDRAIAADPRHEQSRFNKGIVLMSDMGNVKGAIEAWEELLKVNPAAVAGNGKPISQFIEEAKQQVK